MSVWLTPELRPFIGGTYFPPRDRGGRPGFKTVLTRIIDQVVKLQELGNIIITLYQISCIVSGGKKKSLKRCKLYFCLFSLPSCAVSVEVYE